MDPSANVSSRTPGEISRPGTVSGFSPGTGGADMAMGTGSSVPEGLADASCTTGGFALTAVAAGALATAGEGVDAIAGGGGAGLATDTFSTGFSSAATGDG